MREREIYLQHLHLQTCQQIPKNHVTKIGIGKHFHEVNFSIINEKKIYLLHDVIVVTRYYIMLCDTSHLLGTGPDSLMGGAK
jgi:hypothetical protein